MKNLIYIIDDDRDICNLIASELKEYGFEVRAFHRGGDALAEIKRQPPELCITDLGLPDMDGLGIIRQLCDMPGIGVLILSGRGSLPDKVLGLELGADDYISKPFEIRELIARVKSLLRRLENVPASAASSREKSCAKFANWVFNQKSLTLQSESGEELMLSSAEANLLNSLLKKPLCVVSRDQLLGDQQIPYDRSIDSRMSRLRKKLEPQGESKSQIIKTVYGAGYMLTCPVEWVTSPVHQ